ncbi:MAG: FKBP-type peptidyl-prolyl cis-trans isomerase [Thermodesulfobacteriota bacterium]|nr:FKBP-type peptidyl-prolyl cis-trans isomerase [Thermodesulfobacteriota bacterium]
MLKLKSCLFFMISMAVVFSGYPGFAQDTLKTEKEKVSYALGINIGTNLKRDVDVDIDAFFKGIKDSQEGKSLMTEEEMKDTMMAFQQEMQQKKMQQMKEVAEKNKKEGTAFLAENKKKEGVKTLESGLQYKVIKKGTGDIPTADDTVECNYKGSTIDGKVFDSSYKRGKPASFQVGGVIKGWTDALQLMPVGSKWELYIPSDLAYGDRGAGKAIEPGSTLVFEVELLGIQG